MKLKKSGGCFRNIRWMLDLEEETVEDFIEKIKKSSLFRETVSPLGDRLLRFKDNDGNEIIVVPSTGRTEIRLHYLIPESERKAKAEEILKKLR